jgi:ABC-type antimicrobial peptide transport system permease subunit
VNASLAQERLLAILSGGFGALALLLAGLGLYGITSDFVSRRQMEMGIRLALGALPGGVVRFVLSRVVLLIATGIAVGLLASARLSKLVMTLLYGLQPRDPLTLLAAAAMLAGIGGLAGRLGAHRVARMDPAETLRNN